MMKKLFSLTLAMVTALGLMLPASAAEETTDEALARVTQAVKAALDLDTDAYDEFQGSWYEDGLTGAWDLYWSTELEEELSISALDDGTVISYDLGLPYTASNSGDFPVFPQGDEAAAARAAGDFLDKVLREGESVKLEEPRGMHVLGGDSSHYSGVILLNGLPSPLTYSITVDAADNRVRSFHRTTAEDTFLGDVPSAAAAVRRDRFSYAPGMEEGETPALTQAEAQVKAETFLSALCGGRWSALTLYDGRDNTEDRRPYYTFTYVQQVGGIPFPENRYTVAIDSRDGSVYRLDYQYDEDVTFASSAGIVGETAALAAWAGTYDTVLAYRLVPRPLESGDETEARLMELGLTHFCELRLTYALEREERYLGIDAATGKPAAPESGDTAITYTDLSGSGVKADVEKLARYGVGYDGGRFRPDKQLTQWDLVALLASLEGYCIDPETADESTRDTVYSMAYRMGILPRGTRDEGRAVTRGQAVKCLLDCAGYGPAARLQGIYTCTYSDAAAIPETDLGYAAIAQALGMVRGSYQGDRTATRGELAAMLCRLLERQGANAGA